MVGTMTVAALRLEGSRDPKGINYGSLRRNRKQTLDNTPLSDLRHALDRALAAYKTTGRKAYKWEAEYILHNITLIRLFNGEVVN